MPESQDTPVLVDPRELVGAPQVAELIGTSLPTAHSYMRLGKIPSVTVGGRPFARLADVLAFASQYPPLARRARALSLIELKSDAPEVEP